MSLLSGIAVSRVLIFSEMDSRRIRLRSYSLCIDRNRNAMMTLANSGKGNHARLCGTILCNSSIAPLNEARAVELRVSSPPRPPESMFREEQACLRSPSYDELNVLAIIGRLTTPSVSTFLNPRRSAVLEPRRTVGSTVEGVTFQSYGFPSAICHRFN